ncbi:MAG: response regulator transcription factor [Saprospiraceae bacterium]|nr:MAG: LytTR family two component transcriptional regulator [Bacteroidetes bacterium OLB9]MCO6462571.1 response regulator transcription factor [Saprospiraceae bacterium]MCZ2337395.1 LytTR family DNA-binding domain-containing protein [Chitinophagales bacterium]
MIRTIIVDDEPLALEIMETYVSKVPELQLIQKCENALEANEALKKGNVDLMFLDIQMPQLSGIEFLKTLRNPPCVVFTTAYPDYAVEGFELDAVDYLLKPISFERFLKAVNKVSDRLAAQKGINDHSTTEESEDFFFVKADKKLMKVNFDDILYIEGLKDYVIIRQESGRIVTLQTMKSLEERLPPGMFIRIHRSYIVNLKRINAIVGNVVEITESGKVKELPVGKNYRDELLSMINENKL